MALVLGRSSGWSGLDAAYIGWLYAEVAAAAGLRQSPAAAAFRFQAWENTGMGPGAAAWRRAENTIRLLRHAGPSRVLVLVALMWAAPGSSRPCFWSQGVGALAVVCAGS